MTVVQFDIRYLRSLSQQCQRLIVETTPHDLCLRTALPQTQFIRVANGQQFSLANHTYLGTELFGLYQVVRGEEDRHSFARDQAGQVVMQCCRCNRIKPCCRLIQEDQGRMVKERPPFGGRHMVDAPVKVQIVFGGHALVEPCKLEQRSYSSTNFIRLRAGIKAKHAGLTLRGFQSLLLCQVGINENRVPYLSGYPVKPYKTNTP